MLSKVSFVLDKGDNKIVQSMSSMFHGYMMENIDSAYACYLHEISLRPYSQNIRFNSQEVIWEINALTKDAHENILRELVNGDNNKVVLTKKSIELPIKSYETNNISYDELIEESFFGDSERYFNINFYSPTAFKSNGEYEFFPTVRLIFNSLISRYDEFSKDSEIGTDNLLEHIMENVRIVNYNLRSTYFHVEKVKIPSFKGQITLRVKGNSQFTNLIKMLLRYGEYSGVGIKTALGMGAYELTQNEGRFGFGSKKN